MTTIKNYDPKCFWKTEVDIVIRGLSFEDYLRYVGSVISCVRSLDEDLMTKDDIFDAMDLVLELLNFQRPVPENE